MNYALIHLNHYTLHNTKLNHLKFSLYQLLYLKNTVQFKISDNSLYLFNNYLKHEMNKL